MEEKKSIHCTLTDRQLAAKADQWIDELIASGGKSFTMQVPARPNADTDLIFAELNNRFKKLIATESKPGLPPLPEPILTDKDVKEWEGEKEEAATPEQTYGENKYPDLSLATPEQKAETINGLVLVTAREVLKMFLAFGLKTHIECTVVNDPTKEEFDFIFRKKGTAAGREEDACDFAEWMRLNRKSSQNGWVDALGKWDTTKGCYELFKQQKEK